MDESSEFKWTQFEKLIDLHKFYFENLLKAATFSFGIIGAIFTYVVKNNLSELLVKISLVLPLILSTGTCFIFYRGSRQAQEFSVWVRNMQTEIPLGWRPHAEMLPQMCKVFSFIFLLVSIGLSIVIIKPEIL